VTQTIQVQQIRQSDVTTETGGQAACRRSTDRSPCGDCAELVLDVRDLRLRDACGRALVCGVSLAVAPGELVALVGESGSGKTLTARACLGLLPQGVLADAGCVRLAGEDVLAARPRDLRRTLGTSVGFVPQNSTAYLQPAMRVASQMVDGYRTWHRGAARGEALDRAARLLEAVGFDDPRRVLRSYPGELSGGQRQRVNIAMALMGDPRLIVADEPTAALDSVTGAQVMDLLVHMARGRKAALLVISHDLGLVRRRCDRSYVMYAGCFVEEGRTSSVLHDPGHPYTRSLLAAVPRPGMPRDERLPNFAGTMPEDGRDAPGCTYAPRCPLACDACAGDAWLQGCVRDGGGRRIVGDGASWGPGEHRAACVRAWEGE